MGQLVLGEDIQHVALVFFTVQRLFQQPAAGVGVLLDAGIVAGNDIIQAMLPGEGQHFIKLHVAVAIDAGVGCSARFIRSYELFYDLLAEFIGVVDDLKGNIQLESHVGGVLHIFG